MTTPPEEPLPPDGAKAVCLDCGEYLRMANPGWVDASGSLICRHRATLEHVPAPAYASHKGA